MTPAARVLQLTVALLIVGFVSLLLIVGATYWLGQRAEFYFNDATQAHDVRAAAVDLRTALQTAESSQRGYLISNNEIYLAPYSTAKTQAGLQLEAVKHLLTVGGQNNAAVDHLAGLIADKLGEMDQTIALQRDNKQADALAIFRTNRGKALTDEANVFLSAIERNADDRLTQGVAEQRGNAVLLELVTILGGVLIVIVVGAAILLVMRYTRALAGARDEVKMLNVGLEQRVTDRTADLARANDEIQRFAYLMTHDLRAPLVNIMGFTSELERGVNDMQALIDKSEAWTDTTDAVANQARIAATVDLPEAIGFIRSSTNKMDNLINAILRLSREGRRILRPERLNLIELIRASAAAVQHQLSDADGRIEVDGNVPPIVSDRFSLDQVFGNLFDNAVKYRAPGRALRVSVRARALRDDRIEVEVADNGRGIAATDLERIFEMFRRAGTQDQPGDGIGLALVRTLVRNLGGEISVTSVPGSGTTFRITLPIRLQTIESIAA